MAAKKVVVKKGPKKAVTQVKARSKKSVISVKGGPKAKAIKIPAAGEAPEKEAPPAEVEAAAPEPEAVEAAPQPEAAPQAEIEAPKKPAPTFVKKKPAKFTMPPKAAPVVPAKEEPAEAKAEEAPAAPEAPAVEPLAPPKRPNVVVKKKAMKIQGAKPPAKVVPLENNEPKEASPEPPAPAAGDPPSEPVAEDAPAVVIDMAEIQERDNTRSKSVSRANSGSISGSQGLGKSKKTLVVTKGAPKTVLRVAGDTSKSTPTSTSKSSSTPTGSASRMDEKVPSKTEKGSVNGSALPVQTAGMIKFFCIRCGQKLSVQDNGVGQTIRCPRCRCPVMVPEPL